MALQEVSLVFDYMGRAGAFGRAQALVGAEALAVLGAVGGAGAASEDQADLGAISRGG